jgi:hypothetical protein
MKAGGPRSRELAEWCSRSTCPDASVAGIGDVNLDNRRWDRPDQDCELQQARDIPRNLQVDETLVVGGGRGPRGRRAVKVDLFDAVS